LVVTQEIYQREQLLNRVRQLDGRAHEEETYWTRKRAERIRQQKLARGISEKKPKQEEDQVRFVSARLYHQQQQEEEARLNSLYPSRATEEEWKAIQQECREQLSQQ